MTITVDIGKKITLYVDDVADEESVYKAAQIATGYSNQFAIIIAGMVKRGEYEVVK
jgi:hypothetical protein